MTLFLILAAALVLLAVGVVGLTLWRDEPEAVDEPGLVEKNIAIARERLAALDATYADERTDDPDYLEERSRIERQLAQELDPEKRVSRSRGRDAALFVVVLIAVPLSSAWLYTRTGTPAAIDPVAAGAPGAGASADGVPSLTDLVAGLEQRLAASPDDVTGWRMLGRTRLAMNDFTTAADAFARALELEADDVDTLTNLAEARAMGAGGTLTGEALPLLERAYELNDSNQQTLWLLGVARQQGERHEEALELFARLRAMVGTSGDTTAIATIDEYAARSQAALLNQTGTPLVMPEATSATDIPDTQASTAAGNPGTDTQTASAAGVSVTVEVALGGDAAQALEPDTPVFVFARAAEGPPMPLAVQRLTVADLPTTLTLDESMAMIPGMTLANFPNLVLGARASLSGQPVASSGDWSVEVPATPEDNNGDDTPIALTIAEPIP